MGGTRPRWRKILLQRHIRDTAKRGKKKGREGRERQRKERREEIRNKSTKEMHSRQTKIDASPEREKERRNNNN